MIAAVIVLGVVALGLGGYIAWDILRDKKKKIINTESVGEQAASETQSENNPEV